MNSADALGWHWHSEQGATCTENRDACGIYKCGTYTFTIVVDASPRGRCGIQFNTTWIEQVLGRLTPELPSTAAILAILHGAQKHLRTGSFMLERASYLALLLPNEGHDVFVFSCGDCVLGHRSPEGDLEWITRPHTMANAFEELGVTVAAEKRHIVTRTLNARRYAAPEVATLPKRPDGPWMLATDGYRYQDKNEAGQPLDDSSYLLVGDGLESNVNDAASNLFVWEVRDMQDLVYQR